jgi:type I restriction enzyme S subunit
MPESWSVSTMGQIGKYLNGRAFKAADWKTSGRPIIRIQNLTGSGKAFNYFQGEVEPRYLVKQGDLLFSWAATLGTYIWHGPEAVLNQHIFKVESNINPKFHRYLLEHSIQEMQSKTHGSGMVHITKSEFDKIEVPVPPLEQQQLVVEALDDHLSRLDKALAELEHADSQSLVLRRSILNELLDPNESRLKSGGESMKKLPTDWISKRLGDLALVTMGQSPPGSSYNKSGQGMPFFQGKAEFGTKYPVVRQWTTAGTKFAQPGDILMSVRAPVGPTNIADTNCVIGRGLASIRAGETLDQAYLVWFLKHVETSIQARGKGTTFDAISGNDLRDTVISVPPLDEQQRIVETLHESLSRLEATKASIARQKFRIQTLRRSLLHKALHGELGTR